jgi:aspartate/methionine/tyrosine aminotransferase
MFDFDTLTYITQVVWEKCSDVWHVETNPKGYVPLGLAENSLMHTDLRDFLNSKAHIDPCSRALTYGDGPFGSKLLRHALAEFFNDYFHPAQPVRTDHIVVTNGVTSALEHLVWNLADHGEGVLLGRPYYRAFINAVQLRAGAQVVPVTFGDVDPCGPECVTEYARALTESKNRGIRIRVLLLCHPHNPLGRQYSLDTLVELMRLCQKHDVHLIVDEIYALSTWGATINPSGTHGTGFKSTLSIATEAVIDRTLLHVMWGASKDFGANGIRLGVIVSQANPDLLAACRACAYFSSPSSFAENAIRAILSDRTFLDKYIFANHANMLAAYEFATRLLDDHGIEYMPGVTAAFFIWLNLGKKYAERQPELTKGKSGPAIAAMVQEQINMRKIFLINGDAMGAEQPGWFRMVFTQSEEYIVEGIRRIAQVVG